MIFALDVAPLRHGLVSTRVETWSCWTFGTLLFFAILLSRADTQSQAAEAKLTDGTTPRKLELNAYEAEVTGPPLVIENGILGHWHDTMTKAHWDLTIAEACDVEVDLIAAVQEPFGGSEYEVRAGDTLVAGKLTSTGGWHEYEAFPLGNLQLPQGKVRITLHPTDLPQGVFGNVRAIRLTGVVLEEPRPDPPSDLTGPIQVYTTARYDGTRLSQRDSLSFNQAKASDTTLVVVDPSTRYQSIEGFGGAITEATAYVYSQLSPDRKQEFLRAYFDADHGHGYRLCRTHINSCDFSLGSYAYDEVPGDTELKHFSIEHDRQLLIPLIKAAQAAAGDDALKILASPWSPPAWMKTNGKMTEGGQLKPEFRETWARYFCRYIKEYRQENINIWAVTVQNEPMATQRWESCLFTHEEERDFVRDYLGPALEEHGCQQTKLVVWDHNRDLIFHRAKTILDDPVAAKFVWGTGFHWYVTDDFDHVGMVHDFYPDKKLLFTEGCVEHGVHLGDWSAGERYARSVINDLNHWAVGWIDWNLMLDTNGGPNHVGNFCSAPVIGDFEKDRLIYNSSYYYLGHFARFIRPGAVRILCQTTGEELLATAFLNPDQKVAVVILNQQDHSVPYSLQVHGAQVSGMCLDHSIMTLVFDPSDVPDTF